MNYIMEIEKIGKIYKIVSDNTDMIYIGSTSSTLHKRLILHRSGYKGYKAFVNNKYDYITSYEIMKHDDAKIILLEEIKYTDIMELKKREKYYIEINNTVNRNIPSRTRKELSIIYYRRNKELLKQKQKIFYESNKIKIRELYKKKYDNCECGGRTYPMHEKCKKHINYMTINI
jgi:hypothetical protein